MKARCLSTDEKASLSEPEVHWRAFSCSSKRGCRRTRQRKEITTRGVHAPLRVARHARMGSNGGERGGQRRG